MLHNVMKVQVLMSTYNSMRYLREQLQSVYNQKDVEVAVLVRDDGSTDGTQDFLTAEQAAGRLTWYTGPNLKPARSFMDLVKKAGNADFYAFSDHDDIWLPEKLKVAVDAIGQQKGVSLYFCQTRLVDADLNDLPQVPIRPKLTFGESLVYQFVGGCTMVFSNDLLSLCQSYEPAYLRMHDIWIYDIALAVGGYVYFDPIPHILYRQHGHNAVGQTNSFFDNLGKSIMRVKRGEHIRYKTAEELWKGYRDQMLPANRILLGRVINYPKSLKDTMYLVFSSALACANPMVRRTSQLALLTRTF